MRKIANKSMTAKQRADLRDLSLLPDDKINTADLPEQLDWTDAKRGLFYRPIKKQITLRIDADLIEWFRQHTPSDSGYQTKINQALRDYVDQHDKR